MRALREAARGAGIGRSAYGAAERGGRESTTGTGLRRSDERSGGYDKGTLEGLAMPKKYISLVVTLTFLLVPGGLARAQEERRTPPMPKPSAEHKKLSYFTGSWKIEGEMKSSSMGPGGKFTGSETCSWYSGGFAVVCNSTSSGPMGTTKGMGILSYNAVGKVYTYHGIDSAGMAESVTGKVDGNTWTYTANSMMSSKQYQGRYRVDTLSADSYAFKYETSEDGKTWNTVMEGKSTRTGGPVPPPPPPTPTPLH